jgi:hypothetical protein
MVPPESCVSITAISWARAWSPSAIWFRILARSAWLMRGQAPLSKALRAAWMARCVSSRPARTTRAQGSSVAGLMESTVLPDFAGQNSPST